jgi:hypothetical protein
VKLECSPIYTTRYIGRTESARVCLRTKLNPSL